MVPSSGSPKVPSALALAAGPKTGVDRRGYGPLCPALALARRPPRSLAWLPRVPFEKSARFRPGPLFPLPEGAGSRLRAEAPSRTGARRLRSLPGCGTPRQCSKEPGRQRAHLHQVHNPCSQWRQVRRCFRPASRTSALADPSRLSPLARCLPKLTACRWVAAVRWPLPASRHRRSGSGPL